MRHFSRPNHFEIVLSLATSFGVFEDIEEDKKAARIMYESLKPNRFHSIEVFGDFDGSAYDDSARKLVVLGKK